MVLDIDYRFLDRYRRSIIISEDRICETISIYEKYTACDNIWEEFFYFYVFIYVNIRCTLW